MTKQKNMSFVIAAIVCGLAVAATQSYAAEMQKENFDPSGNNWGVRTTPDSDSEEEMTADAKKVNAPAQIPEQTSTEQKSVKEKKIADKLQEFNEVLGSSENKVQEIIQTLELAKDIFPILEHILKPQEYTQDERNTIFQIAKEAKVRSEEGEKPVDDKAKSLSMTVGQFMSDWSRLNRYDPNMRDFDITLETHNKLNIIMFLMLLKSPHLPPIASVIKESTHKTMNQRFQLIMDYMDKNVMVKA